MAKWKWIGVDIHTTLISIRKTSLGESMCFRVSYKNIFIARLFCNGIIWFVNKENWKNGWDFKIEYDKDGNKQFYKRIN